MISFGMRLTMWLVLIVTDCQQVAARSMRMGLCLIVLLAGFTQGKTSINNNGTIPKFARNQCCLGVEILRLISTLCHNSPEPFLNVDHI